MTPSTAIVRTNALSYEFVDADDTGTSMCLRHSGASKPGQLIDTPSLCGRVMLGQRYTRHDRPAEHLNYPSTLVRTKNGLLPMYCPDCIRIWRTETGQGPANDAVYSMKDQALTEMREELAETRTNCLRYEQRVMELDKRMEAMRLMSRGEWCALKELVNEYCARMAEGK